jgi:hypothetical protein
MTRGLSPNSQNELVQDVVEGANQEEFVMLRIIAPHDGIREDLLELFEKSLALNPDQRWGGEHLHNIDGCFQTERKETNSNLISALCDLMVLVFVGGCYCL